MRVASFSLQLLGGSAALSFDFANDVVAAHKNEGVPVQIVKPCEDSTPQCHLRWMMKSHAPLSPFFKFGHNIFRDQHCMFGTADELVICGVAFRGNQCE